LTGREVPPTWERLTLPRL